MIASGVPSPPPVEALAQLRGVEARDLFGGRQRLRVEEPPRPPAAADLEPGRLVELALETQRVAAQGLEEARVEAGAGGGVDRLRDHLQAAVGHFPPADTEAG